MNQSRLRTAWRRLRNRRTTRDLARQALAGKDAAAARAEDARERAGQALAHAEDALARARHLETLNEEAMGRGRYATELARDMSVPTKVLAFMSWLELMPSEEEPLISIILATRDRPRLLTRALASVTAQRHGNWELIIVDDGTDPGTRAAGEAMNDERVRIVAGPQRGLSAARNAGLDVVTGELVCYLDDDNVMHPRWLQAVAQVFSTREDLDVGYGISIAEHRIPGDRSADGWWPSFWQLPWSRETLLSENVSDAGALAHRRDLPDARFDEEMRIGGDWDFLLRLTADRDAMAIPALSHAYSMGGDDRLSVDPRRQAALEEIRRRHGGS